MILDEDEVGILREDELGSLDGIDVPGSFYYKKYHFGNIKVANVPRKHIIARFYHHKDWFPKHFRNI